MKPPVHKPRLRAAEPVPRYTVARPRIYVLAGVNGAGKSSLGGAAFREAGGDYYNPDEAALGLKAANPALAQAAANSQAWQIGKGLLEKAIVNGLDFAIETTLGAKTIPALLRKAAQCGVDVYVWYAGLASPELHIARVKSRVKKGGHDIAEADIRRRYDHSRLNLIDLLPHLAALRVYDNSADADPAAGKPPEPVLVLHMQRGAILNKAALGEHARLGQANRYRGVAIESGLNRRERLNAALFQFRPLKRQGRIRVPPSHAPAMLMETLINFGFAFDPISVSL